MDTFALASRQKLRFPINGSITTEQVWDVNPETLATEEQRLIELVESYGKTTRRNRTQPTKEQKDNQLRLDIITYILDTKEAERQAAEESKTAREFNAKIADIIQRKQDSQLEGMSVEELQKLLK